MVQFHCPPPGGEPDIGLPERSAKPCTPGGCDAGSTPASSARPRGESANAAACRAASSGGSTHRGLHASVVQGEIACLVNRRCGFEPCPPPSLCKSARLRWAVSLFALSVTVQMVETVRRRLGRGDSQRAQELLGLLLDKVLAGLCIFSAQFTHGQHQPCCASSLAPSPRQVVYAERPLASPLLVAVCRHKPITGQAQFTLLCGYRLVDKGWSL